MQEKFAELEYQERFAVTPKPTRLKPEVSTWFYGIKLSLSYTSTMQSFKSYEWEEI